LCSYHYLLQSGVMAVLQVRLSCPR